MLKLFINILITLIIPAIIFLVSFLIDYEINRQNEILELHKKIDELSKNLSEQNINTENRFNNLFNYQNGLILLTLTVIIGACFYFGANNNSEDTLKIVATSAQNTESILKTITETSDVLLQTVNNRSDKINEINVEHFEWIASRYLNEIVKGLNRVAAFLVRNRGALRWSEEDFIPSTDSDGLVSFTDLNREELNAYMMY